MFCTVDKIKMSTLKIINLFSAPKSRKVCDDVNFSILYIFTPPLLSFIARFYLVFSCHLDEIKITLIFIIIWQFFFISFSF